jgi:hypothetical protein
MVRNTAGIQHARALVRKVCGISADTGWLDDLRDEAVAEGIVAAVEAHDTAAIFNWLIWILSFQGISDAVANGYMNRHGNITWAEIEEALASDPGCEKLRGYWAFTDCGYQKGEQTCAVPTQLDTCPLPTHPLRNGRLNQSAYSLSGTLPVGTLLRG